jgi:hypothetical protein
MMQQACSVDCLAAKSKEHAGDRRSLLDAAVFVLLKLRRENILFSGEK